MIVSFVPSWFVYGCEGVSGRGTAVNAAKRTAFRSRGHRVLRGDGTPFLLRHSGQRFAGRGR